MTTHVVILAQGEQKRIPDLKMPKQLLGLPRCKDTPVLDRTLRQLHEFGPPMPACPRTMQPVRITLVADGLFDEHYAGSPLRPEIFTLARPGNSSLRGCAQYLDVRDLRGLVPARTVILLGDVIYSWTCLTALLDPIRDVVIPVSSDISNGGGELWGVAWNRRYDMDMRRALQAALAKHPQQSAYQPGQMRLWLWELEAHAVRGVAGCDTPIRLDVLDYTADIDLPKHTTPEWLEAISAKAAADDDTHGVTW